MNYKHYTRWLKMKDRCYNPNSNAYKNYGERGITVCDEWRKNYLNFLNWTYISGYKDGLTLDRIDNNKGYSPENCKWSTRKEQQNNRRANRKITINGVTKNLFEWVESSGLNPRTITTRIERGWNANDLLNPKIISSRKIKQLDKNLNLIKEWESISEASRKMNIKEPSLCQCLRGKTKTSEGFVWIYSDVSNTNKVKKQKGGDINGRNKSIS